MKVSDWKGMCGCDHGEAPLSYGAYICSKPGCRLLVEATGRKYPDLKLCIKFGMSPRQVFPWDEWCKIYDDDPLGFLPYDDDYIREVFVVHGTGAPVEDDRRDHVSG